MNTEHRTSNFEHRSETASGYPPVPTSIYPGYFKRSQRRIGAEGKRRSILILQVIATTLWISAQSGLLNLIHRRLSVAGASPVKPKPSTLHVRRGVVSVGLPTATKRPGSGGGGCRGAKKSEGRKRFLISQKIVERSSQNVVLSTFFFSVPPTSLFIPHPPGFATPFLRIMPKSPQRPPIVDESTSEPRTCNIQL